MKTCSKCGFIYLDEICPKCFADYYKCDHCNKLVDGKDGILYYGLIKVCASCNKYFNHYHDDWTSIKPSFQSNRKRNLHIGVELEINVPNRKNFVIDVANHFSEDDFLMKEDSSLSEDDGIEINSKPLDKNHIDIWKDMFKIIHKHHGYTNEECGLHVHLDKENLNETQIALIDYMVNEFSPYFENIGGRKFGYYCKKTPKDFFDWGNSTDDSRFHAVNLSNKNTVELRFFNSTIDYSVFESQMKFIYNFIKFIKHYRTFKTAYNKNANLECFTKNIGDFMKDVI